MDCQFDWMKLMSYFFFRLVNRGILVTDRSIMAADDPHQVVHYTYLHIFLWEFCRKKKWFNFGICQYISLQKPNIYTVCKWNLSVRCWKQEIMINVVWDKLSSRNVFVCVFRIVIPAKNPRQQWWGTPHHPPRVTCRIYDVSNRLM